MFLYGTAAFTALADTYHAHVSGRLTILSDQASYPESYQVNGHPAGVLYDLLHDFGNQYNIDITFHQLPLKRALVTSGTSSTGFVGIDYFTSDGAFMLSDCISDTSLFAATVKRRNMNINDMSDIDGLHVGIPRGLPIHGTLARAIRERRIDVTLFNSIRQSVALLLAKRVDVALIYAGYSQHASLKQVGHLTDEEISAIDIHPQPIMNAINRLALPANTHNARLMRRFNSYLSQQHRTGALERLYANHLTDKNQILNIQNPPTSRRSSRLSGLLHTSEQSASAKARGCSNGT